MCLARFYLLFAYFRLVLLLLVCYVGRCWWPDSTDDEEVLFNG